VQQELYHDISLAKDRQGLYYLNDDKLFADLELAVATLK
jgi:hypothetical protein